MDLNTLWFALIAVLFIGFFFLEGFDYGVGMLVPFLGRDDLERRTIINTIGPVWDGNEVWMVTAGGAIFAAFPHWYATMFSGFYVALFLILVALILRGVAFEFRSKADHAAWRSFWDWMLALGSFTAALLWGAAVGNLVRGVPIDAEMHAHVHFRDLLNPLGLLAGIAAVVTFLAHGANYLTLKLPEALRSRAHRVAQLWEIGAFVLVLLFVLASARVGLFSRDARALAVLFMVLGLFSLGYGVYRRAQGRDAAAFWAMGLAIITTVGGVFAGLYPLVMPSTLNPDWSLTIYNAAASPYTLRVMSIVALVFTPLVLLYQGWTYWIFRGRVELKKGDEGY